MDRLIPGADPDIVKPLARRIEKRYEKILLKTKVAKIEATPQGLKATFESADGGAAPRRRPTTACCSRWDAGPTARASARRRRASP